MVYESLACSALLGAYICTAIPILTAGCQPNPIPLKTNRPFFGENPMEGCCQLSFYPIFRLKSHTKSRRPD
jgi:hypothetical protein